MRGIFYYFSVCGFFFFIRRFIFGDVFERLFMINAVEVGRGLFGSRDFYGFRLFFYLSFYDLCGFRVGCISLIFYG